MSSAFVAFQGTDFAGWAQELLADFPAKYAASRHAALLERTRKALLGSDGTEGMASPRDISDSALVVPPADPRSESYFGMAVAPSLRELPNDLPDSVLTLLRNVDSEGRGFVPAEAVRESIDGLKASFEILLQAALDHFGNSSKKGLFGRTRAPSRKLVAWATEVRKTGRWVPPGEPVFNIPTGRGLMPFYFVEDAPRATKLVALGGFLAEFEKIIDFLPSDGGEVVIFRSDDDLPRTAQYLEERTQDFSERALEDPDRMIGFFRMARSMFTGLCLFRVARLGPVRAAIASGNRAEIEQIIDTAAAAWFPVYESIGSRFPATMTPEQRIVASAPRGRVAPLYFSSEGLGEYLRERGKWQMRSFRAGTEANYAVLEQPQRIALADEARAAESGVFKKEAIAAVASRLGETADFTAESVAEHQKGKRLHVDLRMVRELLERATIEGQNVVYIWWRDQESPDFFDLQT